MQSMGELLGTGYMGRAEVHLIANAVCCAAPIHNCWRLLRAGAQYSSLRTDVTRRECR